MYCRLTDKRCEEIKSEVAFMFQECGITTVPIDCFEIAEKLYYKLVPYSKLSERKKNIALNFSEDAFSTYKIDKKTNMVKPIIFYNDLVCNPQRIRWSIFHEIGHVYLGHHDNVEDSNDEQDAINEKEANFFAKYAIAPPPLIGLYECGNAYDIADRFDLTLESSLYSMYYYNKRITYGPRTVEPYEQEILDLFKGNAVNIKSAATTTYVQACGS